MQNAGHIAPHVSGLAEQISLDSSHFVLVMYDGNGNVTDYVTTNGSSVAHYEYGPSGDIEVSSESKKDDFTHRFSTKPYEEETGVLRYQLRDYIVELARWISRDPIGEDGGWNIYQFVGNNSVDSVDKLGNIEYRVVTPVERTKEARKLKPGPEFEYKDVAKVGDVNVNKSNNVLDGTFYGDLVTDDGYWPVSIADALAHEEGAVCRVLVTLDITVPDVIYKSGSQMTYFPHGWSAEDQRANGIHESAGYEAHEKGHARAFLEFVIPKMNAFMQPYLAKENLASVEVEQIRTAFKNFKSDRVYLRQSAEYANADTRSFHDDSPRYKRTFPEKKEDIGKVTQRFQIGGESKLVTDIWVIK